MNGRLVSGAISSIAAYITGVYFKYLNLIQADVLNQYEVDPVRQAIRDSVTYYLQNASFIVGITVGLITVFFMIRNNLKGKQNGTS